MLQTNIVKNNAAKRSKARLHCPFLEDCDDKSQCYCSMPEKKKPKQPLRPKNLTTFGRWIYDLKDYLGVPMMEITKRAGMNASTLSKNTRNEAIPERETVERLEQVLKDIAREKDYPWPASELEQPLYNSASHATQGQIRKADQARRDIISEMVRRRDTLDGEKK